VDEQHLAEMAIVQERRLRRAWALTPEKRLELADQLTQIAMQQLRQNPVALAAYVMRQHRNRRDSCARQFEALYGQRREIV
jgi:hypothetical protein